MTHSAAILSFPASQPQAQELAKQAGLPWQRVELHHFPDGESKITLPESLPEKVFVYQSLDRPNQKLVDLILLAGGLKAQGVTSRILVAPYLCYMRQDKAFHSGEVISQRIIGQLLAAYFEGVLTVDAHLHRVKQLSDAIPCQHAVNVTATQPMAEFLHHAALPQPFLIGPDAESEQWVAEIAQYDHLDYRIATKIRLGDAQVRITLPKGAYHDRHIVLVDDVVSTGHTLLETISLLRAYSPASISVMVTHALFVGEALAQLTSAGVAHIWSCDSVIHPTNRIPLANMLAEQVHQIQRKI